MGKTIKITIAIALMVLSIPFCTRWFSTVGYYFSDEREQATSSLKYRLTGTKTVEVAGLERFWSGEVIIPEKTIYCGYLCTVTSIGKDAFYGCSRITSVKIPTSVTDIGDYAFGGCSELTSVNIPSSVTKIGWRVFSGCNGLTSVEILSSVTEIGSGAFRDCSGLRSVEIPSSVTKIGWLAFKGCKKLDIVIDNRADVEIGKYAFEGCKSVTWKKDM